MSKLTQILLACGLGFTTFVYALPQVDMINTGDVTFSQVNDIANSLQINQSSDKAIVNWHNFNVASNENVHFQQPLNGICLNRIDAANGMSQIAGQLSATSKIILINQAGILFTDSAKLNVGGIIASTANVSDQSFLNDAQIKFSEASSLNGAIINRGTIKADDYGLVALLGASVSQEGTIATKYSRVILESGNTYTVALHNDGLINFAVATDTTDPTKTAGVDENGNAMPNAINVTGKIINDYGDVLIQAAAAPAIFNNLINLSGTVQARQIQKTENGVMLIGDANGTINITGTIDVNGNEQATSGGSIIAVTNRIDISDTAIMDISGATDGGYIGLADSSGNVTMFNVNSDPRLFVGSYVTSGLNKQMPTRTAAAAIKLFNDYKKNVSIERPLADITIDKSSNDKNSVKIDVRYNGMNLNLRSIRPEDHVLVQKYLNSQPLVRKKYANKQTVDAKATQDRVQVLSDRFSPNVTDGCFMLGGFIITDSDTNEFLGMINSGTSVTAGYTELGYLSRPDAWSHRPENLYTEYKLPEGDYLSKEYSGVATAALCSIEQYTELLKQENHTVKGLEIEGIKATAMVDNPGSWKSLAKAGFDLKLIDVRPEYGSDVRFTVEYKL